VLDSYVVEFLVRPLLPLEDQESLVGLFPECVVFEDVECAEAVLLRSQGYENLSFDPVSGNA
jgi:hypothetical protein